MNYRSLNDLSTLINDHAGNFPRDVELVVGASRGGMLVANIIALKLNQPSTDLQTLLRSDVLPETGAARILLVDDCLSNPHSLHQASEKLKQHCAASVTTLVAFAEREHVLDIDLVLEVLEHPRVYEWNIMHHPLVSQACFDIDGVLCVDPTQAENDDGPEYRNFLSATRPLHIPSLPVAHLVTSRLEKYRTETEQWLQRNGVRYGTLHMLDLPSAEERRRLNMHHKFKAEIYRNNPLAQLFIESEKAQAIEIMRTAGKPVFCIETNRMYVPGMKPNELGAAPSGGLRKALGKARRLPRRVVDTALARLIPIAQ
ncbi:phosphoribosyltransferase [Pseudomonas sp. gcc21]|uniref:phosphoribosyltransferase n=1 Tax=Pseudomonas sp. gcc21 TaxID=2726989 RepID=UPI001452506A|nr:phosphoribosyltransferase [Pseudomonas sp. gcc21]QJD57926.1 phosphoribosyltransferase [Pseudomonas sp. gcc21]